MYAYSKHAEQIIKTFADLAALYDGKVFTLTESSDPDSTIIWCGGKTIEVRGPWEKPTVFENHNPETAASTDWQNKHEKMLWMTLPDPLRNALKEALYFDDVEATSWHPEKIAVTFAPAGPKLGNPVIWPRNWPNTFVAQPESPAIKLIELPGEMLDEVLSLVTLDEKPVAVLMGGESKFATIRFIFAGESIWKSEEKKEDKR